MCLFLLVCVCILCLPSGRQVAFRKAIKGKKTKKGTMDINNPKVLINVGNIFQNLWSFLSQIKSNLFISRDRIITVVHCNFCFASF